MVHDFCSSVCDECNGWRRVGSGMRLRMSRLRTWVLSRYGVVSMIVRLLVCAVVYLGAYRDGDGKDKGGVWNVQSSLGGSTGRLRLAFDGFQRPASMPLRKA